MGAFLALANPIASIIDRILPDKAQAAQAKALLLETETQGQINNALAQINVDAVEAGSKSTFVAGWRPALGWTCAIAFFYGFVVQPFTIFAFAAFRHPIPTGQLPILDSSTLMTIMLTLLGVMGHDAYSQYSANQKGK